MLFLGILLVIVALYVVSGYFAIITRLDSLPAHLTAALVGFIALYCGGTWLLGVLS